MLPATLNVATFNCNGILAKYPSCLDTELRIHLVTRFMRTTASSVVGLQELHLKDDTTRRRVEQELERHDLSFYLQSLSSTERGCGPNFSQSMELCAGMVPFPSCYAHNSER